MPNYSLRKRNVRRPKAQIKLPTHLPTLDPTELSKYKIIFIVDLQSFSNKSCNRILNQALFSKIKDVSEAIILIVIKSKFSPMCRECGVGKKGDTSLFLKDRFIKEGDGRVLFQLDSSISSLAYRKELCKYVYKYNTNIVLLSEDKQYGFTIIGSDMPNSETEIYNCYFETFDQSSTTTTTTTTTNSNDEKSNDGDNDDHQAIRRSSEKLIQPEQHHKTKEEQILELQVQQTKKVETWIKNRIEKGDSINLPKTIESLEKSILPFCKLTHCFSNNAEIIKKLIECGDIKVCDTCQTCKPTTINLENQFYFQYLSLSDEDHKQFDWLLKKIITEYTKTPTNLVPIPLTNINKFTLSEKIEIKPSIIIHNLIKNKVISLKPSVKIDISNDEDHDNSSFSDYFGNSLSISTPTKSSIYSSPMKSSMYSSPSKSKIITSTPTKYSTPLKKKYTSSKFSYTSSTSSSSNYYDNDKTYKGRIIYN